MSRSSSLERSRKDEVSSARIGAGASLLMFVGSMYWGRSEIPIIGSVAGLLLGMVAGWKSMHPSASGTAKSAAVRVILLSPVALSPLIVLGLWDFLLSFLAWLASASGVRLWTLARSGSGVAPAREKET